MDTMSLRIRDLATGVASCALLLPGGCRRPTAELSAPSEGEPGGASGSGDACDCQAEAARAEAPGSEPGSSDDRDAPRIVGARFVARDRVQLTFSEPLAPVDPVNPRQFRLSRAYTVKYDPGAGYDMAYAEGYYYDLGGSDIMQQPLVFVSFETYADQPEILGLTLNKAIPVETCDELAESKADLNQTAGEGQAGQAGVFLHYTKRGSVGIRDLAENQLEDFGGEWALHYGARHETMYGSDPVMRLDLLIELECPDASMSASSVPGPN